MWTNAGGRWCHGTDLEWDEEVLKGVREEAVSKNVIIVYKYYKNNGIFSFLL